MGSHSRATATPAAPARQPTAPKPHAALQTCPGCRTTTGPEGALCPKGGSRYPAPGDRQTAIAALVVGGTIFGVGMLVREPNPGVGDWIAFAGGLGLIGAVVLSFASFGRVAGVLEPFGIGQSQMPWQPFPPR